MERKIGEIFEYNGEWYQCVESDSCGECSLFTTECGSGTKSDLADKVFGQCSKVRRTDNKHVIFKKLEKVGEPYERYIGSNKSIKVQRYRLPYRYAILPKEPFMILEPNYKNSIEIGIKQIKEDMEENKLNLKPFDIQKAIEGKPVCTRDGHKARIICFDYNGETGDYPIVALVHYNKGNKCYERVLKYTSDGLFNKYGTCQYNDDLMMLPEKKEGWINIIKTEDGGYCCKGEVNSDYNDAFIENINVLDNRGITVKIEWEE